MQTTLSNTYPEMNTKESSPNDQLKVKIEIKQNKSLLFPIPF